MNRQLMNKVSLDDCCIVTLFQCIDNGRLLIIIMVASFNNILADLALTHRYHFIHISEVVEEPSPPPRMEQEDKKNR